MKTITLSTLITAMYQSPLHGIKANSKRHIIISKLQEV